LVSTQPTRSLSAGVTAILLTATLVGGFVPARRATKSIRPLPYVVFGNFYLFLIGRAHAVFPTEISGVSLLASAMLLLDNISSADRTALKELSAWPPLPLDPLLFARFFAAPILLPGFTHAPSFKAFPSTN
jgi:hypothetical protein